jgi:hypothetical protein
MFTSILGALIAHKQIVIAAIAITGIGVYAFPYNALNQAVAEHGFAANIEREIEIPCLPYCNIVNEPDDVIIGAEDDNPPAHIEITFSFV